MRKAYSVVELLFSLAVSASVLVFALVALVTVVRSTSTVNRVESLQASLDLIAIRLLDDISHAGLGRDGETRAHVEEDTLSFLVSRPATETVPLDDLAQTLRGASRSVDMVHWQLRNGALVREVCPVDDGTACVAEVVERGVERFSAVLLDNKSQATDGAGASRVAFSITVVDEDDRGDRVARELVDSGRMRGGI